jgi:SOS-response transcriptional repressor LexA
MEKLPSDPLAAALARLIALNGGRHAVADAIDANEQSLYQIVSEIKDSKTGKAKGVGPRLRAKLDAHYPGWMSPPNSLLAQPQQATATNTDPGPDLRPGTRVPVVGSVKGGADGYMEELQYPVGMGEGFVEYWTPDRSAYALRVKGDSMHPRYRAGEFIVVTPSIEPQPGRDVVVKLKDGQKLLKQLNWIKGAEIQLLSINNGYAPMTIDLQDVEAIHRVGGSVPSDAFINN